MTSVAFEASVVPHHPAKAERVSRPSGKREDGGFAAMVESEGRPEPKPAASPPDSTPARDAAPPAEMAGPANSETASASTDTDRAVPVETTGEPKAEASLFTADGGALEISAEPDPATIVTTLLPALPAPEPSVAAAAAIPVQPAPETPVPATEAEPAETALPSAPAAAAPEPAPVTSVPPVAKIAKPPAGSVPEQAAPAPVQPEALAAQLRPAAEKSGKTPGVSEAATAKSEAPQAAPPRPEAADAEAPTPRLPEQPSAQAAPVRPHADPGKPETRPHAAAEPEHPALAGKPILDLAAQAVQIAAPAHAGHAVAGQGTAPQAAPVSAAQPVPVNALAVEIATQARAGNARFEIRLDPPELGRIDVRLDIDREGNVTSRLVIERADTYDLMRRDQSALERALQQAGLKTSDTALEFSLRDQGFARHRDTDDLPRGRQAVIHDAETTPGEAASGYARLLGARGGIDIRV